MSTSRHIFVAFKSNLTRFLRNRNSQIILVMTIAIGGGLFFDKLEISTLKAQAQERYSDLQNFTKVLNLVQQYYVEEVDTKKLLYGAIKGMLRELDPHTNFLPPDIFKDFETETSGEFGGLGIEISVQNGILTNYFANRRYPRMGSGH